MDCYSPTTPGYYNNSPSFSPTYVYVPDGADNPFLPVLRYPDNKETKSLDARFDQSPDLKKILDYYADQKPSVASLFSSPDYQHDTSTTSAKKQLWRIYSKITPSVVSVSSFFGVERKIDCSGLIIDWNSSENEATVLTSAKLLWSPKDSSFGFHIIVRTIDGTLFLAKEEYVDYHYNLLILKVKSTTELKVVDLRCRQADIVEGMNVIALGRAFHTCLLFDTTGELYLEYPNFGCEELLRSTCGFSKNCEGGPLITDTGYVIGVNFQNAHPLPTPVILSCLEMWRSYGTVVRPWFGMSVVDVDQLSYCIWERYNIPVEGSYLVVKKVYEGSIAQKNDVRPGDLVATCNGIPIRSAKQYSQLLSETSRVVTAFGDSSEQSLTVVINPFDRRTDNISIEADIISVDDRRFNNCWPRVNYDEGNNKNTGILLKNPGGATIDTRLTRMTYERTGPVYCPC